MMNFRKLKSICTTAVILTTSVLTSISGGITSEAAGYTTYVPSDKITSRSIDEIVGEYNRALYENASYIDGREETYFSREPVLTAPYDAGKLSDATHGAMTNMTNFYRWLMGNEYLIRNSEHSDELQTAALVRTFSHEHTLGGEVTKPEDMSDEMWEMGWNARHSNLADGHSPQEAISAWINEGYNITQESWDARTLVSHRAMLLKAYIKEIDFAYCQAYVDPSNPENNRTDVAVCHTKDVPRIDREMTQDFSVYPVPGYMPTELLNACHAAWSIEFNPDALIVEDTDELTVEITNMNHPERRWTRSAEDETLLYDNGFYCFAQPDDFEYVVDLPEVKVGRYYDTYRVVIKGLYDADNNPAMVDYEIRFFEASGYMKNRVKDVTLRKLYSVDYNTMSIGYLQKVASILPDEVYISTTLEKDYTANVSGDWQVDLRKKCFYNYIDREEAIEEGSIPETLIDPWNIFDRVEVSFMEKSENQCGYDELLLSQQKVYSGESAVLNVYRTVQDTDVVHFYKLNEHVDGTYDAHIVIDSSHPSYKLNLNEPFKYMNSVVLEDVQPSDSGYYISVYFLREKAENEKYGDVPMHVSIAPAELTVLERGDLNGNGEFDMTDAVMMQKMVCGDKKIENVGSDLNHDGRVNVFDMILLKKLLNVG